jgi:hypothetical protein
MALDSVFVDGRRHGVAGAMPRWNAVRSKLHHVAGLSFDEKAEISTVARYVGHNADAGVLRSSVFGPVILQSGVAGCGLNSTSLLAPKGKLSKNIDDMTRRAAGSATRACYVPRTR